jgi:acetyl/propionyl-CoA carboxylase alpha subunit
LRRPDDVDDAIDRARREALAAFGDGTLYVERLVEQPRHVEIQIFADAHGHFVHLFERECSIQRRHQKVVEESPCAALTPALRLKMGAAAIEAARAAQYVNAGTVEFLLEGTGDSARFYFLEMNTRLQVEHPVTEAVTGIDLVHAQIRVASGEPLPWRQDDLVRRGHAIECRIYAEDPAQGFLPQAGPLARLSEPQGPGVRVDAGYVEGNELSVYYDPLIAKLIVCADTRQMAIARAQRALNEFVIEGIQTNIPLLQAIVRHPRFAAADLDTHFLEVESTALLSHLAQPTGGTKGTQRTGRTQRTRGIRDTRDPFVAFGQWRIGSDRPAPAAPTVRSEPRRRARGALDTSAPMPATVVKVLAEPGTRVRKGDTLIMLEAMKMELAVKAPRDGVVRAVKCQPGELVQPGVNLVELEA